MSQDTNYIRIDKVTIKDKTTEIDYTDYRDQDKTVEEGRYEMKKWVSIPSVAHKAFESAVKKLVPHFLSHCHLVVDKKISSSTEIKSIEFKGVHRDTIFPVMEVEGTNMKMFKVSGPEINIHDAESKKFETCVTDFLSEVEAHIISKDSPVQLILDFTTSQN